MKNEIITIRTVKFASAFSAVGIALALGGTVSAPVEAASQRVAAHGCEVFHVNGSGERLWGLEIRHVGAYGVANGDPTYEMVVACQVHDSTTYPKADADYINFHGYDSGPNLVYFAWEMNYNSFGGSATSGSSSTTGYHTVTVNTPWTSTSAYGWIEAHIPPDDLTDGDPAFKGAYIAGY